MKYKAISIITIFFFSVLVWAFVSLSYEYSMQLTVPISIKNLPNQSKVSSIEPATINVLIKGKGWQLLPFSFGNIEDYIIDANDNQNPNKFFTKKYLADNSWLTSNTQVISIEPEIINVKVERGYSKKVKISPDVNLFFKDGFGLVSDIVCFPDSVQILGPWSRTILIDEIKTEKTVLNELESSQSVKLKLMKPEYIVLDKEETEISFSVERIVDKRFDQIEINKINVPTDRELILSPLKISVVLKGGIQKLANMKTEDLQVVIDYNQALTDSVGTLEPIVNHEKYFEVIDIIPNKIKYIIKQF